MTRANSYARLRDALHEGGARQIGVLSWRDGDRAQEVETFATRRGLVLVFKTYENRELIAWDVFRPMTSSNSVDATLAAVREHLDADARPFTIDFEALAAVAGGVA